MRHLIGPVSLRAGDRRIALAGVVIMTGLLAGTSFSQSPTLSIKAVRVNPFCIGGERAGFPCSRDDQCDTGHCNGAIVPISSVNAVPGDVIECEVFASNWSPNGERLAGWHVHVHETISGSDTFGSVQFFDEPRPCTSDDDCDDLGVSCCRELGADCPSVGICEFFPLLPDGAFVDETRADYIYPPPIVSYWIRSTHFASFFGSVLDFQQAPAYEPPPRYTVTVRLAVSDDACGVFTVRLRDGNDSNLLNINGAPILPLITRSLTINLPACVCSLLSEADPPDCSIEARQPSEPDGSSPLGPMSIDLRCAAGSGDVLSISDFSAREIPPVPLSLEIEGVVPDPDGQGADWLRVLFNRPVSQGSWGCVTFLGSDQEFCVGHLPGDVNGDRVSDLADVDALLSCLADGDSACELEHCDLDRSGTCTSRDLLRLIDLLSGAGDYQPWLERTLSTCPSPP